MIRFFRHPRQPHPAIAMELADHAAGRVSRREFLTRVTALGLSAGAARALIGLAPAPAGAQPAPPPGGTVRIQMEVRALPDTRTWDWSQMANICRGVLEYLVEYETDGAFRPMLLERWEVSDDGREYLLKVRPGVTWSNGDAFTATDVARNIARWCERDVPGNSMAGRMASLLDPATGRAAEGAIEVVDPATVALHLPRPDITLIAGMADYPAAIVHASYDPGDTRNAIGTGPYRIEEMEVGARAVLTRIPGRDWWGTAIHGGPYLERIEFLDHGPDPAAWVGAAEAGEIDMVYETVGDYVEIMDTIGWTRSEVDSAATVCIRPNQRAEIEGRRPYADARVRKALQLAVNNSILLELGYGDRGIRAENHHVAPLHPEYADIGQAPHDPARALDLMREAGMEDYEHDLISIDDDWRRNTADAAAAQLRDAGIRVKRSILPAPAFWGAWRAHPFSATDWNHRPLGVQVLALAYRSDTVWNETGFADPEFDATLDEALALDDATARQAKTRRLEEILQGQGVIIQPYWRRLFRHHVPGLEGAEMHVMFEIHPYKLAFSA